MENNKLNIRLSTRSALSVDIDWQSWVAGIDVQKNGAHVLVVPVNQESWQDLLDRAREMARALMSSALNQSLTEAIRTAK